MKISNILSSQEVRIIWVGLTENRKLVLWGIGYALSFNSFWVTFHGNSNSWEGSKGVKCRHLCKFWNLVMGKFPRDSADQLRQGGAVIETLLWKAIPNLMTYLKNYLQDSQESISFSHVLSFQCHITSFDFLSTSYRIPLMSNLRPTPFFLIRLGSVSPLTHFLFSHY